MPTAVEGETCEVDVDADCRLCFFVEKKSNGWKVHFFKGFYGSLDPLKRLARLLIPSLLQRKTTTTPSLRARNLFGTRRSSLPSLKVTVGLPLPLLKLCATLIFLVPQATLRTDSPPP